jgi:hypothetical protein
MQEERNRQEPLETQPSSPEGKKKWEEPKLSFVKPKLTKHGKLEEVTGGAFFGGFTPPPTPG